MKQIVCISTACYYPFPTRKQNIMQRLPESEILYFDPPFTLLAPFKDKSLWKKLFNFRKSQPKPQSNITVYSLPPILPFFNKFKFINRINQKILSRFINKKIKEHNFSSPILWCYSPTSCDIIDKIPHSCTVYDCVDRHSGYGGLMNPAVVDEMEIKLCSKSDAVFCTAVGLHQRLFPHNKNTFMIPNGANYELFSKASEHIEPCPKKMQGIKHPILGFVGMLQDCIDYDMIAALAEAHPDYSIVFIGKTLPGVDISALQKYDNIKILGLVEQSQLPYYISQFDICLNTFKKGKLSKDVSPLKFYEYLATGKPIVSTPEPEQVLEYKDIIEIADNNTEFIEKCEKILSENNDNGKEQRMLAGKDASWDSRVAQIIEKLKQLNLW